jgi:uncharacterized BrkB/YihY/UPF0761 family membrane protein
VWTDTLAPGLKDRVTAPVFRAIDFSATKIMSSPTAGLITFASLLLVWELSRGARSVMVALNEIHDVDESRSFGRLLATTLAVAVVIGLCLVASALAVTVLPRLADGLVRAGLTVCAWALAVVLLGVVVGVLVRYAPQSARPPSGRARARPSS